MPGLIFSPLRQDPSKLLTGEAGGYASSQIIYDLFKARGNATWVPVFIIGIPAAAMFFTGVSSVTANSRCGQRSSCRSMCTSVLRLACAAHRGLLLAC